MRRLVFLSILIVSLGTAHAINAQADSPVQAQTMEDLAPYMLGTCIGFVSKETRAMHISLQGTAQNTMIFNITNDKNEIQEFYCFFCAEKYNEPFVLSTENDIEKACSLKEEAQ